MRVSFLLLSVFLLACNSNTTQEKNNILTKEKMSTILQDIHLAEALFEIKKHKHKEKAIAILTNDYKNIYVKHKIDSSIFNESLKHYAQNPQQLEEIYSNMIARINNEISKLDQQETN